MSKVKFQCKKCDYIFEKDFSGRKVTDTQAIQETQCPQCSAWEMIEEVSEEED